MIRNISIELKMILGAILFVLLLSGFERYEFTQNILSQFAESKKAKNTLLVNTISPIVGLNISLGLDDANHEYLDQIVRQNHDLTHFLLTDADNRVLYRYTKNVPPISHTAKDGVHSIHRPILDPVTQERIGEVTLRFDDHEYRQLLEKNHETGLRIYLITFFALLLFVAYIRQEFRFLKQLSRHVHNYDPRINNFSLQSTERKDEVGIIHNAIVSMVDRIRSHTVLLDDMNRSLAQKVEERTKELQDANVRLLELSTTDPLTLLPNRRYLEDHLHNIWELAKRQNVSVSIIMCDIDHFKRINDTYGHIIGDFVLKDIALLLKTVLKRNTDFIARFGGEEFIVILYDTGVDDAKNVCQSMQAAISSKKRFEYQGISLETVTLSFGIASVIPHTDSQYYDLINLADMALYRAKQEGRNRFVSIGN